MFQIRFLHIFLSFYVLNQTVAYLSLQSQDNNECFCQLQGKIDECLCNIDTVDHFNNVKIYPRLRSLLVKDFFRFFKVNLKLDCPFWFDDSKCAMKYCHVESCEEKDIPFGIKGAHRNNKKVTDDECMDKTQHHDEDFLDYLNKTISERVQENMRKWAEHDDAQDNFCIIDENDEDAEYVDLLLNPERFTGYKGPSARRIWDSIYKENCFQPKKSVKNFNTYLQSSKLNELCLEERVFYRAISGLHTSINIHLCANYLLSTLTNPKGEWGPNLDEFVKRFSPENTNGEGPSWLRNLYFIYIIELRAVAKAAPYLEKEEYYTGNNSEDWDTQMAVKDLLNNVKQFPYHFDEKTMFKGTKEARKLKQEFRDHFRNITRIMDCVGCEKCRLWGKLQTQGLGTALKILFSGKFDFDRERGLIEYSSKKDFQLQRNEIVSLLNALGRLSTSIYKLDDFRQMLKEKKTFRIEL